MPSVGFLAEGRFQECASHTLQGNLIVVYMYICMAYIGVHVV